MATIANVIKWVSNIEEFRAQMQSGVDQVVAMENAVEKTTRSLGGEGLIRAANNAAAAVEKLGGVSKLTTAEQDRLASMTEKALAKYQALGQTAPSALQRLVTDTRSAANESKRLSDETAAIQRQVQAFSGNKIITEANQMAQAITQLGGAEKLTASEQSKVNAVLTEAIGKYKVLGQEAPKTMRDLATATEPVPEKLSLAAKAGDALKSSLLQVASGFALGNLISSGVSTLVSWTKDAIDAAGATLDLSDKTGLSTDSIQKMEFAAKQTGTSMESFTKAAFMLGSRIAGGSGSVRDASEQLGLSWQKLRAMNMDDQWNTVVAALSKVESAQERNRLALDLIGKSAGDVLPAIAQGWDQITSQASIASREQLEAIDNMSDAWDRFVTNRKRDITSTLGSLVLAGQGAGKLGMMNSMALLANQGFSAVGTFAAMGSQQANAGKAGKDVELPLPKVVSYVAALKEAEAAVGKLSKAEIAEIFAAEKLGKSQDDIINQFGITDAQMALLKERYSENKTAMSQAAAEAKKVADSLEAIRTAAIPLTDAEKATALANEKLSISHADTARALGVGVNAIDTYIAGVKNAEAVDEMWAATRRDFAAGAEKVQEVVRKSQLDEANASAASLAKMVTEREKYQSRVTEIGMTGTELALKRIDDERTAEIRSLGMRTDQNAYFYDENRRLIDEFYNYEARLALGTSDTIVERMNRQGILTKAQLQDVAAAATRDYEQMKASGRFTWDEIAAAAKRAEDAQKNATGIDLRGAFSGLAAGLRELGEASDSSFGRLVTWLGQTIQLAQRGADAGKALRTSIHEIQGAFSGEGINWKQFTSGLTNAVAAGLAAGAALWQATDPKGKSTAQTVMGGAMAGQQIGASLNVPGASLVGMGVGALVGWWRSAHAEWRKLAKNIGSDIGVDISQGLAQQIADLEKTIVGGTKDQRRKWAEALSLDSIIEEAGGLKAGNAAKFEAQAFGLFEPIIRGGKLGAQATEQLNTLVGKFADQADKTGGMWDPVFKMLIGKSKELGLNLESVNAAIDKQISKLGTGLSSAMKGAFAGTDTGLDKLVKGLAKDEGAALAEGFKKAQEKGFQGSINDYFVQQANLYKTATEGDSRLGTFFYGNTLEAFSKFQGDAQASFDRLSRIALASFNTIVASGKSAFEAISDEGVGQAVDQLVAKHEQLGLAGSAAYDQLARFRDLAKNNADLVASVSGLNDVLTAMANLGGLNSDVLADLEAQGLDTYAKLQAAGFTQNEALKQMEPFLRNIIKAHEDLGLPIDANTQKVIDLAKANGMLEDEGMSMVDVLKDGLGALIKGFGFDLPNSFTRMARAAQDAAATAKGAINDIPTNIDIGVNYRPGELPDGYDPRRRSLDDASPASTGGVVGTARVLPFALGGQVPEVPRYLSGGDMGRLINFVPKGTDTVPAMLTPGEIVLNATQQSRVASALTAGAAGGADISKTLEQMSLLAAAVARVADQLRTAGNENFADGLKEAILQAQQALKDLDWTRYIQDGAKASQATDDISTGVIDIGDRVANANIDFSRFRTVATGAATDITRNLKGIPGTLTDAGSAAADFGSTFGSNVGGVQGQISGTKGTVEDLRGSVQNLGGDAYAVAGSFGDSFNGTAGIKGSIDGSRGSVDGLRSSVQTLGGDAVTAAGNVAGTAGAIDQSYSNAGLKAGDLKGKVWEIVDANGNVVRTLDVGPWSEWSGRASGEVQAVTAQVDGLIARIATAQRALANTTVPTTGSTPTTPTTPTPGPVISTVPKPPTSPTTPGPIPGGTTPGPSRGSIPGPMRFAMGGVVPEMSRYLATGDMGRLLSFVPKGTDTEPAMLTPGEVVLNQAQQDRVASGLQRKNTPTVVTVTNHIRVNVSGESKSPRQLAKEIAREINQGGDVRTVFGDEIVSIVRQRGAA